MFNWFKKKEQPEQEKFMITEGVLGYWHYHISYSDTPSKSLCGKHTMVTSIPLRLWGIKVDHIPEKFCVECEKLRRENNETILSNTKTKNKRSIL